MNSHRNGAAPERVDFSKIKTSIPIPNLIEVQKHSYERFLQNWKGADADIPEVIEAKKQFATRLAATDSEAPKGWSRDSGRDQPESTPYARGPSDHDGHPGYQRPTPCRGRAR